MTAITLEDIHFSYNQKRQILSGVSLQVPTGRIVGIRGPSGEGKTTLLRLMNGSCLSEEGWHLTGSLHLFNKPIETYGQDLYKTVGTIYQNPDDQIVFTNVVDELVFGMENHAYSVAHMNEKLHEITNLLDIVHLLDRNPNHLSGGEKQLVVLASILCLNVPILLLDEAFAAVDSVRVPKIMTLLESLARDHHKTIIMVEHDMSHLSIAHEIYGLEKGHLTPIK